jgi:hypothetical protein
MRHWLLILVLASPSVLAGAFGEGKIFGQQQSGTLRDSVNTGTAQKDIPNYNTDARESELFNAGQGSLIGPGNGKINHCALGPATDNSYNQQECDAVNFLAKNPKKRPQINIAKDDPIVNGSKQIIDKAKQTGSFSDCKNTVTTKPAEHEENICHQSRVVRSGVCEKILSVSVDLNCTQGATIPVLDLPRNSVDHVYIYAKCDMNALSEDYIEFTADAFGMDGGNARNQLVRIPKDISKITGWSQTVGAGPGLLVAMTHPHWGGYVRNVPVYILKNSTGCDSALKCNYYFYWELIESSNIIDKSRGYPYRVTGQSHRVLQSNGGWTAGIMSKFAYHESWADGCENVD